MKITFESFLGGKYYTEEDRLEMKNFTEEETTEITNLGFKKEDNSFIKDTRTGYIKVEKKAVVEKNYSQVYYSVMTKYDKLMKSMIDNPELFRDATSDAIDAMTSTDFDSYDNFENLLTAIKKNTQI